MNNIMLKIYCLVCVIFFCSINSLAQEYIDTLPPANIETLTPSNDADDLNNLKKEFEIINSKQKNDEVNLNAGQDSIRAEFIRKLDLLNSKLEVKIEKYEYEKSRYSYFTESLTNRKNAFMWNHTSSIIIFWMVIVIVICGLIFSAIQFYISMLKVMHPSNPISKEDKEANGEVGTTTLKISPKGLEVNSSVLGIIILVISLAFFYLYLVYVYPVTEFNIENKSAKVILDKDSKDSSEDQ